MSCATRLLLVLFLTISVQASAQTSAPPFPIIDSVPHVWEWQVIKEEPDSRGLFVRRYHRARLEEEKFGPIGLTLTLKNIPGFGVLYEAWGIGVLDDGSYDFSSATFAFQMENSQWYGVPAGIEPRVVFKDDSATAVVYENEKTIVHRRVVGEEFDGREKFIGKVVRELWKKERHTHIVVKSVVLILEKPYDPGKDPPEDYREPWIHEFKLPSHKSIDMRESLK